MTEKHQKKDHVGNT